MATFKIGQRVRKVRHSNRPGVKVVVPIGTCGVIVATDVKHWDDSSWDYVVSYEGYESLIVYADSDHIEPIVYDGNQVISWDACIWNPSHINKDRIAERCRDHAETLSQPRRSAIIGDQP